jgi:hypothetical protein
VGQEEPEVGLGLCQEGLLLSGGWAAADGAHGGSKQHHLQRRRTLLDGAAL